MPDARFSTRNSGEAEKRGALSRLERRREPRLFQISPHCLNVALPGHHGETRDERLAEFARLNPELPVIALPEGAWLRVSGASIELRGPHSAMWFEGTEPPVRIAPGIIPYKP